MLAQGSDDSILVRKATMTHLQLQTEEADHYCEAKAAKGGPKAVHAQQLKQLSTEEKSLEETV